MGDQTIGVPVKVAAVPPEAAEQAPISANGSTPAQPPAAQGTRIGGVTGSPQQPAPLSGGALIAVGVWLAALTASCVLALLALWPLAQHVQVITAQAAAQTPPAEPTDLAKLNLLLIHPTLTADLSIIILGLLCGVLGSLVHTMTRLTQVARPITSKGTPRRRRDTLWFILAPLQGGLLAFFVIAAAAAGLLSTGQSGNTTGISLFTVATIGGVAGLFSKRMTARLAAVINGVSPPPQGGKTTTQAAQGTQGAGSAAASNGAAHTPNTPPENAGVPDNASAHAPADPKSQQP